MNKVISVFFSGTGFRIDASNFLATRLKNECKNTDDSLVFGFNGCGVDYGFTGIIFGRGLDKQCRQVINAVKKEIAAGHDVTLNVYGHSRGGVAAFMLAKQLSHVDPKRLEINLAVLDPVPGNYLTTATIDPFDILLANKVTDLSKCAPLKRVLALYPYQPLPAIACHAPLFANYPMTTDVEEEVIPGCHAQAEQVYSPFGTIPFYLFYQFMQKCGTPFKDGYFKDNCQDEALNAALREEYQAHLTHVSPAIMRAAHDYQARIICYKDKAKFYNKHHAKLLGETPEPNQLRAYIAPSHSLFANLKRALNANAILQKTLNYIFAGTLITMGLYFSGVLTSLGLTAMLIESLGLLSTLSITAGICTGLSALISPFVYRGIEMMSYPEYEMVKEAEKEPSFKFS